jgi:hypothetical protein
MSQIANLKSIGVVILIEFLIKGKIMCMPRTFGSKLVDGIKEEKKCKAKKTKKENKKTIHQNKVEFE